MTRASLIALLRERHCKWATREVEAMGLHLNNLKWLYYGVPLVMGCVPNGDAASRIFKRPAPDHVHFDDRRCDGP
jgi:hypothetical protein